MIKTNQKTTTKEEIVKKAAKLFAQRGYFGISMQDIAQKLKVSKAALYYHFPSKEKLYQSVLETTFLDLWYDLKKAFVKGATPWDKLFSSIEAYLLFSLNRPEINLFFQQESSSQDRETQALINKFKQDLLNFFKQIIKMEAKGRQIASNQVVFLATLLLTTLGKSILIATLPPRFVAKQIINLIFPPKKNKKIEKQEKRRIVFSSNT